MSGPFDVKRSLDAYRAERGVIRMLEVPELQFLMIDGSGDPNTSEAYRDALEALYPLAYALKFASKRAGRDYVVPPLEGLWWADDPAVFASRRDKSTWQWTLMILTPDWVGAAEFAAALERVAAKRAPVSLGAVRLERLAEGTCIQALHVGRYDDEGDLIARMHDAFMPEHSLRPTGHHHEIYLSDPRRVPPEKLRTIIRQPVAPVG